jgi:hypothetical protein
MLTYLVVPATLGDSSLQRIYAREAQGPLSLADYRRDPDPWFEVGHARGGRVVAFHGPDTALQDFRSCEPFYAPLVVLIDAAEWRVEVIADSTGNWCGNAAKYATWAQACEAARDLFSRWTAVREWRVVPV